MQFIALLAEPTSHHPRPAGLAVAQDTVFPLQEVLEPQSCADS